jgi:hypothetical protein
MPVDHIITWPEVAQELIREVPNYIAAVGALLAAYLARQAVVQGKELHLTMNSRLSQLIAATAASSHAEGMIEGAKGGRAASIVEFDARESKAASSDSSLTPTPVTVVNPEPVPVVVSEPELKHKKGPVHRQNEVRGED